MATSTITSQSVIKGSQNKFTIVYSDIGFDDVFNKVEGETISLFRVNVSLSQPFYANNFIGIQWGNGTLNYGVQLVFSFANNKLAIRNKNAGTWGTWTLIG